MPLATACGTPRRLDQSTELTHSHESAGDTPHIDLISAAKVTGLSVDEDLRYAVFGAARAEGVTGWAMEALHSLLADPIVIGENDGEVWFVNGQHRTRAMRDAGVTEVLVADSPRVGTTIRPQHTGER